MLCFQVVKEARSCQIFKPCRVKVYLQGNHPSDFSHVIGVGHARENIADITETINLNLLMIGLTWMHRLQHATTVYYCFQPSTISKGFVIPIMPDYAALHPG